MRTVKNKTVFASLAGLMLAACGVVSQSSLEKAGGTVGVAQQPWEKPVRKAICGANDKTENGLQGQVPIAERLSGRSQEGYNCNLELVGQWQGDGAGWQTAWTGDCAYYGTNNVAGRAQQGTVVIDASQHSNPHPSAYLSTTPMLDPWESLKVHQQRKLLGAVDGLNNNQGSNLFDVYDVSDCKHPRLLSTTPMDQTKGHEGNWAQTGLTYWEGQGDLATYSAFDVADPTHPEFLLSWKPPSGAHGMSTNTDGTRGYFVANGPAAALQNGKNGLMVVDTSDVEARKPGADMKILGEYYWLDGSETAQHTIPIKIKGHPYLVFVDEISLSGKNCGSGLSPFAFARILDLADETKPSLVSKLMLETHDPANCEVTMADFSGQPLFAYDSHYCGVDDPEETTAVACGYFNSGIRVFDVRNPYFPREIAYFNPPAQLSKMARGELKGSKHASFAVENNDGDNLQAYTADWCSAQVRFLNTADDGGELWTTCQDNGFMILKFTNGAWPFKD